jgi:hypothetical protein
MALRLDQKMLVLDIDNMDHWKLFLANERRSIEDFKSIPQDVTPNGGIHYIFSSDDRFKKTKIKALNIKNDDNKLQKLEIDLLAGSDRMVFVEPSFLKTEDGSHLKYTWKKNITDDYLPDIPEWLALELQRSALDEKEKPQKKSKTRSSLKQEHIDLFKKSNIFDPTVFENATFCLESDSKGRFPIDLIKGISWDCTVCNKKHINNSNRPFLYFSDDKTLWYCCRGEGTSVIVSKLPKGIIGINPDFDGGTQSFAELFSKSFLHISFILNIQENFFTLMECVLKRMMRGINF